MANMTIIAMGRRTYRRLEEVKVPEFDAMYAALKSYGQPLRPHSNNRSKLPDGILLVIKAAAGDTVTVDKVAEALGEDKVTLQDAASFYLQQQLVGVKTNPFQQLGLSNQASLEEIALHKRWLLKWLHPDRNPNKWQSQLFNGVTIAANAANSIVTPGHPISEPSPPMALQEAGKPMHRSSATSQRKSTRSPKRKRVRIVNWREVLWRITRRVTMVLVILPLVYFGTASLFGDNSKWATNSFYRWLK
jgi:hypothetical protein